MSHEVVVSDIESMVYIIRSQKVMLDSDLAKLYKVETKRLNEQVRRNIERFPNYVMFQLSPEEHKFLKSQIATSKKGRGGKQKQPLVFTENGIAMLSSVLNSKQAIQMNISIMRIFTKLRSFLLLEKNLSARMSKLEQNTNKMFKIVFERLDDYEDMVTPKLSQNRKKIGFDKDD